MSARNILFCILNRYLLIAFVIVIVLKAIVGCFFGNTDFREGCVYQLNSPHGGRGIQRALLSGLRLTSATLGRGRKILLVATPTNALYAKYVDNQKFAFYSGCVN